MSKEHNLEILNCIYKNSKMAAECIEQVEKISEDSNFNEYLHKQAEKYSKNCAKLSDEIKSMGGNPEDVPVMQSAMANAGIAMKTIADKSTQNLAKLMYNGTNMGIVDISRVVNRATNADCAVVEQAKMLLNTEQDYASGLKNFL